MDALDVMSGPEVGVGRLVGSLSLWTVGVDVRVGEQSRERTHVHCLTEKL